MTATPAEILDMYKHLEFVICSGRFEPRMKSNSTTDFDKNFIHDSVKWSDNTQRKCLIGRNGYALLTGKISNVTAIDIDDEHLPHCQKLRDLMTDCNMIAKTRKGVHYLFKYDPRIRTVAVKELSLDTRNDGGLLYVSPSNYITPGGEHVEYSWDVTPNEIGDSELKTIPESVITYLQKLSPKYINVPEKKDTPQVTIADTPTSVTPTPETEDILYRLADEITNNDTYDDWLRNGIICFNERLPLEVWESMSKKSHNYDPGACAKKWATFSSSHNRKVTQATWWKWLKLNKPDRYKEIMEYRSDIITLLELINHNDIAKYFYNLYPTNYVYNKALGWFSLGENNIWIKSDKGGVPSCLKRHLSDTMQDLTRDAKIIQTTKHKRMMEKGTGGQEDRTELLDHQNKMKNIIAAYKLFGSSDFCNGVISFLNSYYEDDQLTEKIDMSRTVFAFTDGLYDIEAETFRPIKPTDWVSTTTGYPYPRVSVPSVRSELTSLMWNIFEDTEVTEYMWNVLSSAILGTNRWEELYTFTGSGGNGKGVINEILKTAFGKYYYSLDVTLFTKPRERADQPIPALVEARPCRLLMTSEPEADGTLQAGLLKKITGGDLVEARTLHSPHIISYVPQFTLILQTNAIPRLNKIDGGIQRRLRVIRFPFQFVASPTLPQHRHGDPDVKDRKCKSPEWRNEFILMLIERLQVIRKWKSLVPPLKVKEVTNGYLDEQNPIKDWLDEHYVITHWDEDRVSATEMRNDFLTYKPDCNLSTVKFKELMGFNGVEARRITKGIFFCGIKKK